ncbi:MAG: metal ABC transporter solute-binding protein, Zn/Mn family [Tissierella sp.]|uniref:metal ABC transporter solute-binding protein, Zn/Mn family n=1 Tax=Tissierella sp. TaxID=41274 RepID=UPI003F9729C4
MKRFLKYFIVASITLVLLTGCGKENNDSGGKASDETLKVVTSFTIIQDIAREIGGDNLDIHNLVPTGTDPHEYEPLPKDIKKATDADILFYNGLNLEGGKNGWFFKMMDSVGQDEENIYSLTERVDAMYLSSEDGTDEEINPHAFIDPAVGIKMAEDMRDALMEKDPDRKEDYEKKADEYIERLKDIDKDYEEKINDIEEKNRILITSERAYQYMADHYGLKEGYIWAIDTEENGSPEQIKSLIKFIDENDAPVLFVESNVDRRPMETVSNESGVQIVEKPIYSDEIGKPGEEVDTYVKYLNYNIKLIHDALK